MTTILHILQHALGRDEYGRRPHPRPDDTDYRNHYVASEGHHSWEALCEAVAQGLMVKHPPNGVSGGGSIFVVTLGGEAYIREHSPKPPRLTRSAQRYRRFLNEDCSEKFGEWLRMQKHRGRSERA